MSKLNFTQSICRWLYQADDARTNVVFLLPPEAENLPGQISLAETWENFPTGCYGFLPNPLAETEQAGFAHSAWIFLNDPTRRERPRPAVFHPRVEPHYSPRFAWFANPGQAASGLIGQAISLYYESAWLTDRLVMLDFGDYILQIVKGCSVSLNADESGFEFSPPDGLRNEYHTPGGPLIIELSLAIGGAESGAFQFGKTLDSPESIAAFIKTLQPEIRFFYKTSSATQNFPIASQRYPVLSSNLADWVDFIGGLFYQTSLHPLKPLVGHEITLSCSLSGASLPSHFRTNLGYPIHLTPKRNCKLIYAENPSHSGGNGGKRFYLTLAGDFEISVPGKNASAAANLICGLSGAEYIRLPDHKKNILTFIPGCPAFTPSFTLGQFPGTPTGKVEKLTSTATTAWVYVSQTGPDSISEQTHPLYFSQPDQALLYKALGDGNTSNFLAYMEVPATALPPQPDPEKPTLAFPIAPYGEVAAADIENYQKFESGLLTPARRDILHQITSGDNPLLPLVDVAAEDQSPHRGTTPQGLLATYSRDFKVIQSLVLAQGTDKGYLEFKDITRSDPLRAALQSNQLFLVISDPESIKEHLDNNQLAIQEWMFDLNPDKWNKYNTLLVFKFHNQSLQELASGTQSWTLADKFSIDPGMDRLILDEIIQGTLAKVSDASQDKENYSQLAEAIRNPRWNGILAFNVPVPPGGLPPELVGMASGIDETRFCAQHVGIASSTVQPNSEGELVIQKSSLFGLIDYVDARSITAGESGYNFTVTKLNVLFQNSEVKHFAGEVILVLDKLFGGKAALQNSPTGRNEIVLVGRCETHNGKNTYSFSSGSTSRFELPGSNVINEIEIVKAQFSTDPPAQSSGYVNGEPVNSRFAFWGRLDFLKVEEFDILSFGSEPTASGDGIRFSNLQVVSTFPWGNAHASSFSFSAGRMIFDIEKSQPRAESLFKRFPLKLTGLLESNGAQTPDSLGYMPVRTPLGSKGPESGETWYGLAFDLNLGSAGALAGKAGIVVSLLAAWKPETDGKVYTGLRLPGSSGGKREISIQGILKIAFKRIEIQVLTDQVQGVSYLMKIKNIVLKFMTLELPPSSQSEIIIFGDPSGEVGGENTLAWYAAYARERGQQTQKKLPKDMFAE